MRIEVAPVLGCCFWTDGLALCLQCREDRRFAADFPSAWRTVELANRRHKHLLLPKQRHFCGYFSAFRGQRKSESYSVPCAFLDDSKSRELLIERITCLMAHYEPFCTVLLEQASESGSVQMGNSPAKPDGLTYPSRNRPTLTQIGFARHSGRLHKAQSTTGCWAQDVSKGGRLCRALPSTTVWFLSMVIFLA